MGGNNKRYISKASAVYIAVGVVLIAVMTIFGTSAFMGTSGFIVDGISVYTEDEVVEASGLSIGDNLLFINIQAASQSIKDALPFVSDVQVTRKLPDIIHIAITESRAIAYILFAGEFYVIDSSGRVLDRIRSGGASAPDALEIPGVDGKLIEIRGVEIEETVIGRVLRPVFGTETKLQYMQDVLIALEREGLEDDVSYLDVSNIVNVHFEFLGKFKVILSGSVNLRPSNLRHNIGTLLDNVDKVEETYPNSPGDLIYGENGQAEFRVR